MVYVAQALSKSTGVAMPTKYLTDRTLGALRNKRPAAGQRADYMDTIVSGFGLRVNDAGAGWSKSGKTPRPNKTRRNAKPRKSAATPLPPWPRILLRI